MLSAQVGLHVHTMTKWASTLVHRHQACILTPSTGRGIFVHSCKAINQWQPKHPLEQAGRWPQSFLRHCASLICEIRTVRLPPFSLANQQAASFNNG